MAEYQQVGSIYKPLSSKQGLPDSVSRYDNEYSL